MKSPLAVSAAAAAVLLSASAFAACDDGETVIKFSHVTNSGKHPKGIAASLLAERVNDEMNGSACMEVFPNTSLYNDDQALEALLNGDLQLAAPSLSKFEKFTKQFRIFDLPFMFKNINAVDFVPGIRRRAGTQGQHAVQRAAGSCLLAQWNEANVGECSTSAPPPTQKG